MEKWKEESQQNNNFRSHMSLGKKKKVPDLSLCGPAQLRQSLILLCTEYICAASN